MKKLISIVLALMVSCFADETKISESKHFQVYETNPFKKIVIKYEDKLTSQEFECFKQAAGIFEINDHQALLTRNVGYGTDFDLNQLTLFQVEKKTSILNSIKSFFGKSDESLSFKIYEFSNEEILKQARAKLSFDFEGDKIKVSCDKKEIAKLDFESKPGDEFHLGINEGHVFFSSESPYNAKTSPRVFLVIAKLKKGEKIALDNVAEISFFIDFSVKDGKLEFELKDPKVAL